MTMLDQLLQILSPQNDKIKKGTLNNNVKKSKTRKGRGKPPKPPVKEERPPYLDPDLVQPTPRHISLHKVVHLPIRIEQREWIATQVTSLFQNINLEYGTMSEFCTAETCPTMQGAGQMQYLWVDDRGKKLKCTAPQYIDYVMTFCQKSISNESLFPTKYAQTFVSTFYADISKMMRFLFHVLSHMYAAHFTQLQSFGLHGHLNIVFMHFVLLAREFNLFKMDELDPLKNLIDLMQVLETKCTDGCASRNHHQRGSSSSTSTPPTNSRSSAFGSSASTASYNTFSSAHCPSNYGRNNGLTSQNSKSYVTS